MTAAIQTARYFVLVVDGTPLTQEGSQDMPVIFREEDSALAAARQLQGMGRSQAVTLEAYADDYSFLGARLLEAPALKVQ